ncbi:hypothetical protein GFS31_21290 [Leptolyngbya sp. BL0902]|nr:hypothetical protein GFS31_21290 [Leptolyngbya sp. BL0902]
MTPEDQKRLEDCTAEIAEILYRNSNPARLDSLAGIEQTVRQQMLEEVSPRVALVLGVTVEGTKSLLGLWIGEAEAEGAKFWLKVLTDLKNRGLRGRLKSRIVSKKAHTV